MQDFNDIDRERDLYRNRVVTLEGGQKLFIRQDDQYNFWSIHNEKGKVAEALTGRFTNFETALRTVQQYAENILKKPVVEVIRGFNIRTDGHNNILTN